MGKMKNVMVLTTGRADYGLLYPLIKKIEKSEKSNLILCATGSHLSKFHGYTLDLIKKDNIAVDYQVDLKIGSDTEQDICSSISIGIQGFSEIFLKNRPDVLILLGDRYELFCVAIPAVIYKIPIVHLYGGEVTKGAVDDSVRHCVTKMSSLHFASLEIYRKRIIQMGEFPDKVFNVGALGIDNIKNTNLPAIDELKSITGADFRKKIALMTYHPVTLDDYEETEKQINEILNAIKNCEICVLATMPNADSGNSLIFNSLKNFSEKYPQKLILVKNLGQRIYLGAMKYCSLVIGNSSSGIIESPYFKTPVVNIGDRQAGRFKADNIIDCECQKEAIEKSVEKALSLEFRKKLEKMINPYGEGNTAEKILNVIDKTDFSDKNFLKKGFYDYLKSDV
ncbi:MAG: UDP-N-acetylglucosamine 2-epimerase (hydrolyzing) [Deltaproteobacteria bacterium]|nr:MAG: UDP-N-acetylglucosamine 2-epimerase (hydrolyzing) [Deltaproteobacteria bacterium]PIE75019.1 MAG: UDP-N-acetylglucosamine 2-epimerase (hydrolyzing) [Deltaproteobacteria bacterium]